MGKESGVGEKAEGWVLDIRPGNEWLSLAAEMPEPKKLFGELWLEGEMALIFGDTGKGKSVLAVQMGDAIARGGGALGPLVNESTEQKVLVVDLDLSAKQFQMRYSGGETSSYEFPANFKRMSGRVPFGSEEFVDEFCEKIKEYLVQSGTKVLIVDHVTAVRCTRSGTAAVTKMVARLGEMRDELGLSVLMLAQSPKREMHRPISINDLGDPKHFGGMVDSIFAVGQSRADTQLRYVKQIKTRSTTTIYGEDNVAVFRLAKLNGNFLGFEFDRTDAEVEHLAEKVDPATAKLTAEMKQMADSGWSQREIAATFGISKTRVNRLLKMWRPSSNGQRPEVPVLEPNEPQPPVFYMLEKCIYELCKGCGICKGRPGTDIARVPQEESYGHKDCPNFCEVCGPPAYKDSDDVDEETRQASDEFFEDLREWLVNGKAGERPKYIPPRPVTKEEREAHRKQRARQTLEDRGDTHAAMLSMGHGGCPVYLRTYAELYGQNGTKPAETVEKDDMVEIRYRGPDKNPDIVRDPDDRMVGLKRALDTLEREIFIEEEHSWGERKIWYRYDSKGRIERWVTFDRGNYGDGKFDKLPPIDAPIQTNGRLCREMNGNGQWTMQNGELIMKNGVWEEVRSEK